MDNDISKNFLGKKLNSSHLGEIIPKQDKNQKIKIDKGNIDQDIIVPASSINKSNIENRHVESVLSGLNLKESICRKGNSLFWKDGRKKGKLYFE